MTAVARGPYSSICIIFQALCKIDIQEVGRTAYRRCARRG